MADVAAKHLNRISVYLPPAVGLGMMEQIAATGCDEVWFNPGSESAEIMAKARALGLRAVAGCSIVDLGMSPSQFP